jgi:hypothetical protein
MIERMHDNNKNLALDVDPDATVGNKYAILLAC